MEILKHKFIEDISAQDTFMIHFEYYHYGIGNNCNYRFKYSENIYDLKGHIIVHIETVVKGFKFGDGALKIIFYTENNIVAYMTITQQSYDGPYCDFPYWVFIFDELNDESKSIDSEVILHEFTAKPTVINLLSVVHEKKELNELELSELINKTVVEMPIDDIFKVFCYNNDVTAVKYIYKHYENIDFNSCYGIVFRYACFKNHDEMLNWLLMTFYPQCLNYGVIKFKEFYNEYRDVAHCTNLCELYVSVGNE